MNSQFRPLMQGIIFLRADHRSSSNRTLTGINQEKGSTMKTTRLIAAMTVSASLVLGLAAQAQEETPVEMKDLPTEAQTTIKEKTGNDQIVRIAKETRKGKECYDAVVNKNGKEMAIRVDSTGKFMGTHPEKAEPKAKTKGY
jgi:hypothetical protein